ncbi:ribonuclease domain-containing protein [Actinosynnema sp. NPDC059335]|uniref:ribonuclease domain-containing protein n=1 Tax=Actinosynnema sp. NPDC059335 TaxID=3346804 RepID=UPI00366D884E
MLPLLLLTSALLAGTVTAPASAAVYDFCVGPACEDAREALEYWEGEGLPARRVTHVLPGDRCYTGGGTFGNLEGQLPAEDRGAYREFDVYPRPCGQGRDAHRIVVNHETLVTWYTGDHYRDFHRL